MTPTLPPGPIHPQDYCCETCSKYSTKVLPIGAIDIHICNGKRMSRYTYDTTKHTGCLSHSALAGKCVIEEDEIETATRMLSYHYPVTSNEFEEHVRSRRIGGDAQ